jgi:hypothetical protein
MADHPTPLTAGTTRPARTDRADRRRGRLLVALATDRAAVKRWPKDKITLRIGVIEQSWED